jgi:hypothetical protein
MDTKEKYEVKIKKDEQRSAADTAAATAVIRVHSCQFVVKVR